MWPHIWLSEFFLFNVSHRKSLHGEAVLQCTLQQSYVCKCVCVCASKKNGFFSMAQFHLECLCLSSAWVEIWIKWMKDVSTSSSWEGADIYEEYSTFLTITGLSCALQCNIICLYFFSPVDITTDSAFQHTLFWENKPSSRTFLGRDEITVKVEDHRYLNSWTECCQLLVGNQTTNMLIYLTEQLYCSMSTTSTL